MGTENKKIGVAALSRLKEATAMNLREAFLTPPPPADFVFRGVLAGGIAGVVGPGATGKSWLAFNVIAGCAFGEDYAGGMFVGSQCGRVLYLPNEDPCEEIRRRLHEFGRYLTQSDKDRLVDMLKIFPLAGLNPWLMDSDGQPVVENIEWLRAACQGKRLVILDTLRRFHTGNENDSGHMTMLLGILEQICHETGCTFVFLHHTNKSANLSGNGDLAGASRGSAVLTDNPRGQYNLVGVSKDRARDLDIDPELAGYFVEVVPSKINHGAPQTPLLMQRQPGGPLLEATPSRICALERRMLANGKIREEQPQTVENAQGVTEPVDTVEEQVNELRYQFERYTEEDGYEIASPW